MISIMRQKPPGRYPATVSRDSPVTNQPRTAPRAPSHHALTVLSSARKNPSAHSLYSESSLLK